MKTARNGLGLAAGAILASLAGASSALAQGADIIYCDFGSGGTASVANFGSIGTGDARAWGYAYASFTTNIGNAPLRWNTGGNNGAPIMAMNFYRLHNGRIEQIGLGFAKYACCVANGTACTLSGPANCTSGGPSGTLRPGCTDSYSASYNGGISRLGPRSGANAMTGVVAAVPAGTSSDPTFRRVRVLEKDMRATDFPGALYFIEGVFVCTDDAPAGNGENNATYRRVTINQTTFAQTAMEAAQKTKPAIYAWRDYGNGVSGVNPVPDTSVTIRDVDVPNEGRFVVGGKATNLGNGTWRYDYAVMNINSHRSAGGFTVPVQPGVTVTNVTFRDIDYHSGEIYSNTDWNSAVSAAGVTWSSPQTFAQNPNTNALRWGTMYNFSFIANTAPAVGNLDLAMFRPGNAGDPNSVAAIGLPVPSAPVNPCPACPADFDQDGGVTGADVEAFFLAFEAGDLCGDTDQDGGVTGADVEAFFSAFENGGC